MEAITNFINTYGNEASFVVASFIGGLAHFLKKSLKGETTVGIHEWFGAANLNATLYTFIMFFFVIAGSLAGGIIDIHTPFWAALYTGFVTGYTVDSGFNSDGGTQAMSDQLASVKGQVSFLQPAIQAEEAREQQQRAMTVPQPIQCPTSPSNVVVGGIGTVIINNNDDDAPQDADPPVIAAGSPPPTKKKVIIKH